jgi:AcrR family transcriptional regulator
VSTVSRRYASGLREEQARQTRGRIVAAAGRLFLERGYGATTITEVAAAAGTSVATVYNAVGGKPALLKAVYDTALAGDDAPVPMAERPAYIAMRQAPDARAALHAYAGLGREMAERALPLLVLVLGSHEPDLQAFAETIEGERLRGTRMTAGMIQERYGLRAGLTADRAGEILWALTSPEVAQRLVLHRGWSWDEFQAFLGDAATAALVG